MTTFAPAFPKASAMARPNPWPEPVMRTRLPATRMNLLGLVLPSLIAATRMVAWGKGIRENAEIRNGAQPTGRRRRRRAARPARGAGLDRPPAAAGVRLHRR